MRCHYEQKNISVERSLKNVTATLAFEVLKPSSTALNLSKELLEGKVTGLEARTAIFNKYNIKAKAHV